MELDIAKQIVEVAKDKRYITGPLTLSEELAESEKPLLSMIITATRHYAEAKPEPKLEQDEVASMFLFVYAKAVETVYNWHKGTEYVPTEEGLFTGRVPLNVPEEMQRHFHSLSLASDLYDAFTLWESDNKDYCILTGTHPILPITEGLKWCYRISLSNALEFLGYAGN